MHLILNSRSSNLIIILLSILIAGNSSAKSEYLNDTSEFIKQLNEVSLSNDGIINKKSKGCSSILKELKINTNIKYLGPNIISMPFSKNDITAYEKACPNIAFDKHVFCNNSEFYDELNEMTDDEKEEWEDKICRRYMVKRTMKIYDVNIFGNGDKNIVVYSDGLYRENNRENYDSERILKLKKRGVFRQWKYESAPYKKTAGTDIEEGKYLLYNLKNCSVVSGVGTIYAKYNHRLKENNNNYNGIFIYKDNYYIYNLYTYGQDNGYRFKLNKLYKNTGKFSSYCSFH